MITNSVWSSFQLHLPNLAIPITLFTPFQQHDMQHAATDTSEDYDSDVIQKGLRNILAHFRTNSKDDDSDASPKRASPEYSPTGQYDSSNDGSDSESDSESHQDDENASDSDVEIIS